MNDGTPVRHGRIALISGLSVAAGVVKLAGLPPFVWALRDEAAPFFLEGRAGSLSPAWLAGAAAFVVGRLHLFVAFWMLLGLSMVVAGAALPRRGRPARAALEGLCWFGIVEAPAVAAFILAMRRMLLRPGVAGGEVLAASLVSRFWASLAWLGIYVLLLVLLQGTKQGDRIHAQAEGQSQGAVR